MGQVLDEDFDIAVRTGYHCAPFIHKYLKDERNVGTVRVGVGRYTSEEDLIKLKNFINSLNNVQKVELLPYHDIGKTKWENLGFKYPLENTRTATLEDIKRVKQILDLKESML